MTKVAVGIIIKDDRILLCQRKRTSRYELKWEFPGGKFEHGERPEQCLERELLEELGINPLIGQLYHTQNYVYPDSGSYEVFYYRVTTYTGEIVNNVFESYQWVPIDQLQRYDILEGNTDVVKKLMQAHESVPRKG